MDLSKFKLEIYDVLGLILPGLLALFEIWVAVAGYTSAINQVRQMDATDLTLLLLFAFVLGTVVQEFADLTVKTVKGERYLKKGRDQYWLGAEADALRQCIRECTGRQVTSVDAAFDLCLSEIADRFAKRDVFVAISDLSRSLVVLALTGIIPVWRNTAFTGLSHLRLLACIALSGVLLCVSMLMWRRMVRFRALSEGTVFRTYLATSLPSRERPDGK